MTIKMIVKKRAKMSLNRWMLHRAKVICQERTMMNTMENLQQMKLKVKAMAYPKETVLVDSIIRGNEGEYVFLSFK